MKEILKKHWYVGILILCIILLCFVVNNDLNSFDYLEGSNSEIVENINSEEVRDETNINEDVIFYVDIKGEVKNPGVYEINSNSRVIDAIKKAGGLTKNADTSLLNLSKKIKDEMNIKIYSKEEVKNAKEDLNKEPEVIEIIKEIEKECVCPENNEICNTNENKNDALIEKGNDSIKIENIGNEDNNENDNSIKEENNNTNINVDDNNQDTLVNINIATKEELMTLNSIGESKALKIIEYRNKNRFTKIEDILNVSGIGNSIFEKIKDNIKV